MTLNRTGRYAPSPSGRLHLGNLRTALIAWLLARSQGAEFLLRIEDLDPGRSREDFVAGQRSDLEAIGLDWDRELPRQSSRGDAYEDAVSQLRAEGLIYECFCTRAEIREAASAPHGERPEGAYPGTCRELGEAERTRRAAERPAALRVRAGAESIEFEDRCAGPVRGPVDDFVVRRNDGAWGYNLATAVDDCTQGIGEVVRGRDLLDSTPRQIWLQRQLGLPAIASWAHVPLVLGPDGERLSKRHGAITPAELIEAGASPDRTRDELALSLGLREPGERVSMDEILARFELGRLPGDDVRVEGH